MDVWVDQRRTLDGVLEVKMLLLFFLSFSFYYAHRFCGFYLEFLCIMVKVQ